MNQQHQSPPLTQDQDELQQENVQNPIKRGDQQRTEDKTSVKVPCDPGKSDRFRCLTPFDKAKRCRQFRE